MEAIAVNFERLAARWGDDACELDTLEFVEACEVCRCADPRLTALALTRAPETASRRGL